QLPRCAGSHPKHPVEPEGKPWAWIVPREEVVDLARVEDGGDPADGTQASFGMQRTESTRIELEGEPARVVARGLGMRVLRFEEEIIGGAHEVHAVRRAQVLPQ